MFRSKAGEAAHMFRCHGIVSSLRWLFDTTACPSCLREYHTYGRLKAHLHANETCRKRLQNRPALPAPEVGIGSTENTLMEHRLNGLLPPLQGHGPLQAPGLMRDVEDFDVELYAEIAESLLHHHVMSHQSELRRLFEQHFISWTMCVRTVGAFAGNATLQDAQAFGYEDLAGLRKAMEDLMDPAHWDFMRMARFGRSLPTKEVLTQSLDDAELRETSARPCAFGVHRLVLHAFSGRRRPGDFQEYLDAIMMAQEGVVVHVVSVDIVLSATWGDVSDPACQRFWYEGVRSKYVVGYLAGPPCETWSQARAVATQDEAEVTHWKGPRILRTLQDLWGKPCLAIREMKQILTGNQLLLFSFHMMLLLYVTGGYGALEHPAPPKDEEKASIWRTSLALFLCSLPGVKRIDFAQGLLGAKSPKPKSILSLNLPDLVDQIWRGRVCDELPQTSSIGRDSLGRWKTSTLKEYPPSLCKALAESFAAAVMRAETDPTICICTDFWSKCKSMVVTDYGQYIGPDFAG